jgi:hypothetical protein
MMQKRASVLILVLACCALSAAFAQTSMRQEVPDPARQPDQTRKPAYAFVWQNSHGYWFADGPVQLLSGPPIESYERDIATLYNYIP